MKHNKVFLVLIIFALVLVALAVLMGARPKLKYLIAKPTTYAQCVEAGGKILESFPTRCSFRGQTFTNPDQRVDEPPTNLKTYQDKSSGFSFQYPANVFVETQTQQQYPFFNKTDLRLAVTLSHEIPVEHCDLMDGPRSCEPTTKDITITFMPLDIPLAEAQASMVSAVGGGPLDDINLGQVSAKTAWLGAEGEGVYYYLMALPDNRSLLITRTFIDEGAILTYQTAEDFIPRAKQDQIFTEVAATLKIDGAAQAAAQVQSTGPSLAKLVDSTADWETFTNNTRGYTIKYPKTWIFETVNNAATGSDKEVRYLKFTSPDKKFIMTVGIKKTTEDVQLAAIRPPVEAAGQFDITRGSITAAGAVFPMNALINNGNVSDINYYSGSQISGGVTVKDYQIRAELYRITGNTSLDQAPELAIANSILASLTLTK